MSRVLVVPDIHLKPRIFDKAACVLSTTDIDSCVVLGDIVDDWNADLPLYKKTIDYAMIFDGFFPQTLWCIGNHDYAYLHQEDGCRNSGFCEEHSLTIKHWLEQLVNQVKNRLAIVHLIDGCAFSHAGISQTFFEHMSSRFEKKLDIHDIAEITNAASTKKLWEDDSPLWFRPTDADCGLQDLHQVAGHTPMPHATKHGKLLLCDTFSTRSDGTPIGDCRLTMYNTDTHEFQPIS